MTIYHHHPHRHRYPHAYLNEEAGEEEQRAENHDAEGTREHGVLEGFHHLVFVCVWGVMMPAITREY